MIDMEWNNFSYFNIYNNVFDLNECKRIVDYQSIGNPVHSVLRSGDNIVRDSNLFWLYNNTTTDWIFERLRCYVDLWNANYNYEIDAGISALQLTSYGPGQEYDLHTDIGALQSSRRKISLVVQLNDTNEYTGGGKDVLVTPNLRAGDIVVFHSWMQHKAHPVIDGKRWSLAGWYLGNKHLC
jgi:hypothetical protein